MNRSRTIAIVLMSLTLSGCVTASQLATAADQISDGAREFCRFAPSTTSILAILNVPGAPQADEIVEAICAEVAKVGGQERSRVGQEITVDVLGVQVVGVTAL